MRNISDEKTQSPGAVAGEQKPILLSEDESWISRSYNAFAERFLQSKKTEFLQFREHEETKAFCWSHYHSFEDEIGSRQQRLAALQDQVATLRDGNLARSIWESLKNGNTPLYGIASDPMLVAALVVKSCATDLLALARKDLADYEAQFVRFKAENKQTLHELGLL